ncbi:MAG: sel1 repeat family protein [Alphaproteobacteria bacterium]|nr:sel1 repeat family protein [Alphaproteobacteria bacterium]
MALLNKIIFYYKNTFNFFLIIGWFSFLTHSICAGGASLPLREDDQQLYDKGIHARNEGHWEEAKRHFKPLAKKNNPKAQHNLAYCLHNLGDEENAYRWYSKASKQGLEASKNNLNKMNLFYLLLPNEIIAHVVSYFDMQQLASFNATSSRANKVVKFVVTHTNFLTSQNPYALQFKARFNGMQFTPMPIEIRLATVATVTDCSIEAHFRHTTHLRNIVDGTPLIRGAARMYFVHNPLLELEAEELVPTSGTLYRDFFINIVAATPLKLGGKLTYQLPYPIHFPKGTNTSDCSFMVKKGGINCGKLNFYDHGNALADAIDTFDGELFTIRTLDAHSLIQERKKSRLRSPKIYPGLHEVCPDAFIFSTSSDVKYSQFDYISSKKPLIYISKTIPDMTLLQEVLPDFSHSISFIDPTCHQSGVYCKGPLVLAKGFEVSTNSDLTLSGVFPLFNHALFIRSSASLWILGPTINCGSSLTIRGRDVYYGPFNPSQKPDGMPESHWNALVRYFQTARQIQR